MGDSVGSSREKLVIGTRGSKLALWQSEYIKGLVEEITGLPVELKIIKTTGDKILDVPLAKVGGKGLFTKELEVELLAGTVDLCVHSMKDVPTELPEGLYISRDARARRPARRARLRRRLHARHAAAGRARGHQLASPHRARCARCAPTSRSSTCAATSTPACARPRPASSTSSSSPRPASPAWAGPTASPATSPPSRWSRRSARAPSASRSARTTSSCATSARRSADADTFTCVTAERVVMRKLEGGCQVPIGAYARLEGDTLVMDAIVGSVDGDDDPARTTSRAPPTSPVALGESDGRRAARDGRRRDPRRRSAPPTTSTTCSRPERRVTERARHTQRRLPERPSPGAPSS